MASNKSPEGAIRVCDARNPPRCSYCHASTSQPVEAPAVAHGWRPIGEAPKDGTEVWAFNGEQGRMRWIEGDGYALWTWADTLLSDTDPMPEQPTHFMPLPADPVLDVPVQHKEQP